MIVGLMCDFIRGMEYWWDVVKVQELICKKFKYIQSIWCYHYQAPIPCSHHYCSLLSRLTLIQIILQHKINNNNNIVLYSCIFSAVYMMYFTRTWTCINLSILSEKWKRFRGWLMEFNETAPTWQMKGTAQKAWRSLQITLLWCAFC